jgi:hypothetical protein
MGIFSKKEKTPEKELYDAIWYETNLALAVEKDREDLYKIVKKAYKSGASCDEIRRVYMENLPTYRQKSDIVYPGLQEVVIDGLSFQVPYLYTEFLGSVVMADYTCNKFASLVRDDDGTNVVHSKLDIYVFKSLNMDQVMSILPIDKNVEFVRDITYGGHTGIAGFKTGMFNTKRLEWFIYEREGKMVAICSYNLVSFNVYMDKIANGWAV